MIDRGGGGCQEQNWREYLGATQDPESLTLARPVTLLGPRKPPSSFALYRACRLRAASDQLSRIRPLPPPRSRGLGYGGRALGWTRPPQSGSFKDVNFTPGDPVIRFDNVAKSYAIYDSASHRLQELLTLNRIRRHRDFWALQDISFSVHRGETFCVIGENGSGKSTLLQMVAGILKPTRGMVDVRGRVAALLELGSGFNPEFSGRDNVYLNGAILGFSAKEMDRLYDRIVAFAEIGDFIHQPVKTYSSGMAVRLAFAVAIHVSPDILLVDEALAVGDIYFRQRCMRKVHELRAAGVTILFVSHAIGDVKAIGDRTLWLDQGRIRELGPTDQVVARYLAAMTAKDSAYIERHAAPAASLEAGEPPEFIEHIPNIDFRHGDGRAEITGIAVLDELGRRVHLLTPASKIVVRISARAKEAVAMPNVGFLLRNHLGVDFAGANTLNEGHPLPPLRPGQRLTVDFHIDLPALYPGDFSFSPAIADGPLESTRICDWIDNALTLQMGHSAARIYGYLRLPCRVEVNARLAGAQRQDEALLESA
jgi:lipopolysaccharide transport system ATP-binding protein